MVIKEKIKTDNKNILELLKKIDIENEIKRKEIE